ncbi:hypothetical protein LXL04_037470 [Taraxacum kok-saghyz]
MQGKIVRRPQMTFYELRDTPDSLRFRGKMASSLGIPSRRLHNVCPPRLPSKSVSFPLSSHRFHFYSPFQSLLNIPAVWRSYRSFRAEIPTQFGGTLFPYSDMYAISELQSAYENFSHNVQDLTELGELLRDWVVRPTPLEFIEGLTETYMRKNGEGPEIYLKREDKTSLGSFKQSNVVGEKSYNISKFDEKLCLELSIVREAFVGQLKL